MLLQVAPDLEVGIAHLQTKGLGLVGSSDNRTVVVAQNDHRNLFKVRSKNPLA